MAKKENNYYFEIFQKSTAHANQAAVFLQECVADYRPEALGDRLEAMHRIEQAGDSVKHEMMERLVKEFLPPIEREDIMALAHNIDEVTDCTEDVLRRMYMHNVTALRPDVAEFVGLIARICGALQSLMAEFANYKKSAVLRGKIVEVSELEEEGDRLYTAAMRRLYLEERDPVLVLTWTVMYDILERCCDSCEHVADVVEQVVLKNS